MTAGPSCPASESDAPSVMQRGRVRSYGRVPSLPPAGPIEWPPSPRIPGHGGPMSEPSLDALVHDWNREAPFERPTHRLEFDDETLRDGLQSPSVHSPTIDLKIEILH